MRHSVAVQAPFRSSHLRARAGVAAMVLRGEVHNEKIHHEMIDEAALSKSEGFPSSILTYLSTSQP